MGLHSALDAAEPPGHFAPKAGFSVASRLEQPSVVVFVTIAWTADLRGRRTAMLGCSFVSPSACRVGAIVGPSTMSGSNAQT